MTTFLTQLTKKQKEQVSKESFRQKNSIDVMDIYTPHVEDNQSIRNLIYSATNETLLRIMESGDPREIQKALIVIFVSGMFFSEKAAELLKATQTATTVN